MANFTKLMTRDASIRYSGSVSAPILADRVSVRRDLSKSDIVHILFCVIVNIYIYIYAFSRRFYPKRLTIAFRLYIFISMLRPTEAQNIIKAP